MQVRVSRCCKLVNEVIAGLGEGLWGNAMAVKDFGLFTSGGQINSL